MSFADEHFTGTVVAEVLAEPMMASLLAVYVVNFCAGAHTHWHTHPKDQGLYVTEGVALVHAEGRKPMCLGPGESIWIDAGQRHWHGAAPDQPMIHVAYQLATEDLTTVDWHEPVSVETYDNAARENH